MSPELMQEKAYDTKSDIWSLGCLIYELCALKYVRTSDLLPVLTNFKDPHFMKQRHTMNLAYLFVTDVFPPFPAGIHNHCIRSSRQC